MHDDTVQVEARWTHSGSLEPRRFKWQGKMYSVESTGRQWEDAQGLHVLCMVPGGQVFELIFHLNPAGWLVRPPGGPSMA